MWYVKRNVSDIEHSAVKNNRLGYNRRNNRSTDVMSKNEIRDAILSQIDNLRGEEQTNVKKCASAVQSILIENGVNSDRAGEIASIGIDLFKSDKDVLTTNKRVGKIALPPEYMKTAILQNLR